jgi:NADP+-dependent farnesol dehydrogenase
MYFSHEPVIMEKWMNKVAVVSGGNSGCGLKIVEELLKQKLTVVCLDLKDDEIKKRKCENLHSIVCDITDDDSLISAFKWIEKRLNGVNILINNAGMTNCFGILEDEMTMQELRRCMNVNFLAGIHCTKLAHQSMVKRDQYGCIINISSVAGHRVIDMGACKLGLYTPSKHAITATAELLRLELNQTNNKKVRVTNISPGLIDTPLFTSSNLSERIVENIKNKMEKLETQDIADTIIYILSLPHRIHVADIVLRATGSTF